MNEVLEQAKKHLEEISDVSARIEYSMSDALQELNDLVSKTYYMLQLLEDKEGCNETNESV